MKKVENKIKIYNDFESPDKKLKRAVTVGAFDGLHLGHISILNELKLKAKERDLVSTVVTFSVHPQIVLGATKGKAISLLSTIDEKINDLIEQEIDEVIFIQFTKEFSKIDSKAFIEDYLVSILNAKVLISGYDNRIGSDRAMPDSAISDRCKEDKIEFFKVEPIIIDGLPVSSTSVRQALMNGDLDRARHFLGEKFYNISGIIKKGEGLGRKLGYPTANLLPFDSYKLIPKNGVYFSRVKLKDRTFFGMTNIGNRPTVSEEGKTTIETNIFDFNEDIYGEAITLEFIERLREEKKFASLEELVAEINSDKIQCQNLASKY